MPQAGKATQEGARGIQSFRGLPEQHGGKGKYGQPDEAVGDDAVSYTHLTLPTIA